MEDGPAQPARFLRTRHLVAAIVPLLVIVLGITGFVWAQKGITLVVDGESRYVKTQAATVGALLEEAEVAVGESDVVTPPADATLTDGMTVVVRHAVPVTLVLAGERIELNVVGSTVAEALVAAGIDPGRGLRVTPALDAPLAHGMIIEASDVFVRVVEERTEIPFEVRTEQDPASPEGSRAIKRQGVAGTALKVYRVLVTDGVEGARTLTSETVIEAPVDEIVLVGTKRAASQKVASRERASTPPSNGTKLTVTATAYSPQDPGVGGTTATGAAATRGVIAVDPSVIPLGTRVYVPGYGEAVAADTGGAIGGAKIDVCFDSRAEALAWGRRTVTITILP